MEFLEVTRKEAYEIIESQNPKGSFYAIEGNMFVGIDNTGKELYVEEFSDLNDCKRWLNGEFEV